MTTVGNLRHTLKKRVLKVSLEKRKTLKQILVFGRCEQVRIGIFVFECLGLLSHNVDLQSYAVVFSIEVTFSFVQQFLEETQY